MEDKWQGSEVWGFARGETQGLQHHLEDEKSMEIHGGIFVWAGAGALLFFTDSPHSCTAMILIP